MMLCALKKDELETLKKNKKLVLNLPNNAKTNFEIIDNNFYGILREILSICNYAIHGENVTDNQVKFVTKNAKQVLDYLYQVK